ncbi:DNA-binding SARP family transcriptional activator [Kitasatospora sp. GP82]|nr:AfsR/SARP family transcriptional regulator [Kitasatospora sp. GP82]MDH6128878.1 DNA-binding SARP family transcriptional activator [Kitasatospora sp. GP82]
MVKVRLLGTVDIQAHDQILRLGSDRERGVLASLAHDLGRPVSRETLAERIWDDDPPATAYATLQAHLSKVRRVLRTASTIEASSSGRPAPEITRVAHTYRLEAEPESVDWQFFMRAVGRARSLAEAGDDLRALHAFRQADSLWQGEALAGLPGIWAHTARLGMDNQRLAATLARFAIELRLGRFTDLVPELSRLFELSPDNEALASQLIIALYGCGRQGDALDVYQRTRTRLLKTLGAEPGEQLARIHRQVLQGAPPAELLSDRFRTARPGPGTVQGPSTLPPTTRLVGRREELARLTDVRGAAGHGGVIRIEAISGMGGIGKTTLAVHAAEMLREHFPDAQLYLNLRAHSPAQEALTPEAALSTLLRALRVPPQSIPETLEELGALWQRQLASRRAVIILDDAADPDQVRPLLPEKSPSLVLVTSRHRLAELPGTAPVFVQVLSADDAVALFRHLVGPDRADDADLIRAIVERCGYLPLAVTMVASRFKAHPTWSLHHLAQRLTRESGRLGETRHRYDEIAGTFAMSYLSLTPDQQTAFRRLGLHPGPDFGPHDAAALFGLNLDTTERILESLLDCHLLEEPAPDRFRAHDLLADYAALLAARDEPPKEREQALYRLIAFCLLAADRADRLLYPRRARLTVPRMDVQSPQPQWADEAEAHAWLVESTGTLVSVECLARRQGHPAEAAWLAHVLGEFLHVEGHFAAAETMHRAAATHWEAVGDTRARARALLNLCATLERRSRYTPAYDAGQLALTLAKSADDLDGLIESYLLLATLHWAVSEFDAALLIQRHVLRVHAGSGSRWNRARILNNTAVSLSHLGKQAAALAAFTKALSELRHIGDSRLVAGSLSNIGQLQQEMGDLESARRSFEESLALASLVSPDAHRAAIQMNLASTLIFPEELPRALGLCRSALATCRRLGDRRNEANALIALGHACAGSARHDEAHEYYTEARELARTIGAAHEEATALHGIGKAAAALGDPARAVKLLAEAVNLARLIRSPVDESRARETLDSVVEQYGESFRTSNT